MKKNYALVIGILLLLLIGGYFVIRQQSKEIIEKRSNEETEQLSKDDELEILTKKRSNRTINESNVGNNSSDKIDKTLTWAELDIVPVKTVEKSNYVFSAFDFDLKNNELVIARSDENHFLMFISDSKKTELQIPDTPLDIIVKNENTYVLGLNKFFIVRDKKIKHEQIHNIPYITTFDKLIFFENSPTVLMADGSSYRYKNDSFIKSNSLNVNNTEVWVQKTSPNSFEIESKPKSLEYQKQASYNQEIGSISFLGENLKEYYVVLDVIKYEDQKPYVQRELKSSRDSFKETIIELPRRDFSFIKNDIKIHNNTIYTVTVTDTYLNIKSYN